MLNPSHAPEKPIRQRATIVPSEGFFTSGMAEARKALDHGFPYAAIVLAYAVTEGVLNFVCERRLQPKCRGKKYLGEKAACLHKSGALSAAALAAVLAVHGSRDERNVSTGGPLLGGPCATACGAWADHVEKEARKYEKDGGNKPFDPNLGGVSPFNVGRKEFVPPQVPPFLAGSVTDSDWVEANSDSTYIPQDDAGSVYWDRGVYKNWRKVKVSWQCK